MERKPLEEPVSPQRQNKIGTSASYTIEGRCFDVERVFREEAHDTIATILLKLIQVESEQL